MNSDVFWITVDGHGPVELDSSRYLSPDVCNLLQTARENGGRIRCRCGKLLDFVYRSSCPHLRNVDLTPHTPGCLMDPRNAVYIPGGEHDGFPDSVIPIGHTEPESSTDAAQGFSILARRMFSRAYVTAICQHYCRNGVIRSDVSAVLAQFRRELGHPHLCSGSVDTISRRRGWHPIFGVAADIPAGPFALHGGKLELPWTAWRWTKTGFGAPGVFRVRESELARAMDRFRVGATVVCGPYFFFALADDQLISQLFLCPAAVYDGQIAPVDSHAERLEVSLQWFDGNDVLKLLRLADQAILPPALLSHGPPETAHLRYRPDLIVHLAGSGTIMVEEVNGDLADFDPDYGSLLERKRLYYRDRESLGHFRYREATAEHIRANFDGSFPSDRMPPIASVASHLSTPKPNFNGSKIERAPYPRA